MARKRTTGIPPVSTDADAIPEGYVVDYLTGKHVKDTPEEYVRQNIEKALVRQYRYVPSDCWPEFRIKMGSARPRVDIVIFEPGAEHLQENAFILMETKKPGTKSDDKRNGTDYIKSYMAACLNVRFGMWTNGDDRFCYEKVTKGGQSSFEGIVDIPVFGQPEEDAYRPSRSYLMAATADNLLFAFRRCHNYIAGTEGLQKPDAFWELLKLIFCKIEDERSEVLDFYVSPTELGNSTAAAPAKARIQRLMSDKVVKKYPRIFTGVDRELGLKPNVVAYVVSQLQSYSLLASPVDVKGVAYEEVVGSNLRGDRGEFFTPRNACRMAVRMLSPQPDERLLDPACGTGGFLIIAMNHALATLEDQEREKWRDPEVGTRPEREELYRKRAEYLASFVFGFDLNPALVRAAKMNMVMNNDGEGSLYQADSLANPHTWNPEFVERVKLGSVDVLFTNPPFGTKIVIDDIRVLEQYDLAAVWDQEAEDRWVMRRDRHGAPVMQKSQPPEILFIERCLRFVKEGTGRLAMVIPNGILNNPALGYVRQWMRLNTQVIAVVDMARTLFQPKNDTQTSMVLMRRLSSDEQGLAANGKLEYPVFMAVAESVGKDNRANAVYRRTPQGDEVLAARTEKTVEIDPETGKELVVETEVLERLLDDELPDVAEACLEWLERQVS